MNLIAHVQGRQDSSGEVDLLILRAGRPESRMTRAELCALIKALHQECSLLSRVSPGTHASVKIHSSKSNK